MDKNISEHSSDNSFTLKWQNCVLYNHNNMTNVATPFNMKRYYYSIYPTTIRIMYVTIMNIDCENPGLEFRNFFGTSESGSGDVSMQIVYVYFLHNCRCDVISQG